MIEKIIEKLSAESEKWLNVWNDASKEGIIDNYADGMNDAFDEAISIVQEVAKEYGKDTNVRSNGRKLNRCDTCTYYVADTVPPICYFCSKGMEDNYKAREGE